MAQLNNSVDVPIENDMFDSSLADNQKSPKSSESLDGSIDFSFSSFFRSNTFLGLCIRLDVGSSVFFFFFN